MLSFSKFAFNRIAVRSFSTVGSWSSPTVAVVLSGSGVYDGSEIIETSSVLVNITRSGAKVQCYAPDILQMHVIDHSKGEPIASEQRNVLVESARIARGAVKPLSELLSSSADAVIFPGGFGAAKNLSTFATEGTNMSVNEDVERVLNDFHSAKKPIGLCCIAPILAAKVLGNHSVQVTMGKGDDGTGKWKYAGAIDAAKSMGAFTIEKNVNEVAVDIENKVVTTPAYMFEGQFHEIHDGVAEMVKAIIKMIKGLD